MAVPDPKSARRIRKAQISVYLDAAVMKSLADYAARREQPQSMIPEAAIASFLSPDADERREAVVTKRLDQIDRLSRPRPAHGADGTRCRHRR